MTVAVAGLVVAAVGTAASIQQGAEARKDQKRARREQDAARGEQAAQGAAEAAQARRQQVREERIKRAQILQAAANTGTAGSTGMLGAVGGMQTQLGSNMGLSQGNVDRGQRIGVYNQNAANFMGESQTHANRAGMYGSMASFGFGLYNSGQPKAGAQSKVSPTPAQPKSLFGVNYQ